MKPPESKVGYDKNVWRFEVKNVLSLDISVPPIEIMLILFNIWEFPEVYLSFIVDMHQSYGKLMALFSHPYTARNPVVRGLMCFPEVP